MQFKLNTWLGPLVLGSHLNAFLLGFVIIQVYQYFTARRKDRIWVRLLVLYLLVMETFAVVLDILVVWNYTVTHFGDPSVFMRSTWSYTLVPTILV